MPRVRKHCPFKLPLKECKEREGFNTWKDYDGREYCEDCVRAQAREYKRKQAKKKS